MASFAAAPFAHQQQQQSPQQQLGFQPQFTAPEGHPLHLRGYLPSRTTLAALDGRAGAPIAPLGAPASTLGGNARRIPLDPVVRGAASLRLRSVELPLSFTQFSAARGNTSFAVGADAQTGMGGTAAELIPDGNYTPLDLVAAFRARMINATGGPEGAGDPVGLAASLSRIYTDYRGVHVTGGPERVVIANVSTTDFTILFTSDATSGALQRYLPASQLGWSLGFRAPLYVVPAGSSVTAEAGVSVQPLRSVLVRLGGGGGLRDGFQAAQAGETVAKILLPPSELFGSASDPGAGRRQGTILCATEVNGLLLSGTRVFREQGGAGSSNNVTGGTEMRHLDVELLDEFGRPLDLQGDTFSLTVEIAHG